MSFLLLVDITSVTVFLCCCFLKVVYLGFLMQSWKYKHSTLHCGMNSSCFWFLDPCMPVTTRRQSRLAAAAEAVVDLVSEENRSRRGQALDVFPRLALRRPESPGDLLQDRLPESSVLVHLPALVAHPQRWIVERFIFGAEVSNSIWLGAVTSISVSQELSLLPRPRRFRSGALVSQAVLD